MTASHFFAAARLRRSIDAGISQLDRGMPSAAVSGMPPWDLQERTRLFALAVLAFCRALPHTDEAREAAGQLRRAANAVRNIYRAARRGRSRAEFRAKLGNVFEEADECVDWLSYLHEAGIRSDPALLGEARELASIFARAVRTARRDRETQRGPRRHRQR